MRFDMILRRASLALALLTLGSLAGCKRVAEAPADAGGAALPALPPSSAAEESQIAAAQQTVARDPTDVQAWIELGNGYFDTHQREKAIEAYGKALALRPDNPDVLTDQGTMYREIGAYDKAIANFEKANRIDPKHMQSLFNLGVVYARDLRQPAKAIQIWKGIIEKEPASSQAGRARAAIREFEGGSGR